MSEDVVIEGATAPAMAEGSSGSPNVSASIERGGYLVLKRSEQVLDVTKTTPLWEEAGTSEKAGADQAIRDVAGETEGTYIAVPLRSWKPRTVKVENVKNVKLG